MINGIIGVLGGVVNVKVNETEQLYPIVVEENVLDYKYEPTDFSYTSFDTDNVTVTEHGGLVSGLVENTTAQIYISYTNESGNTFSDIIDVIVRPSGWVPPEPPPKPKQAQYVILETLTASENGQTIAPAGEAYNKVNVQIPAYNGEAHGATDWKGAVDRFIALLNDEEAWADQYVGEMLPAMSSETIPASVLTALTQKTPDLAAAMDAEGMTELVLPFSATSYGDRYDGHVTVSLRNVGGTNYVMTLVWMYGANKYTSNGLNNPTLPFYTALSYRANGDYNNILSLVPLPTGNNVSVTYNGQTIASSKGANTIELSCGGKIMGSDIVITVT